MKGSDVNMLPRERMPMRRRTPPMIYRSPYAPYGPMRIPQQRQRGGLLSKIFGRKERQAAPHPFMFQPPMEKESRGFLQTITNPEKITHFLTNTQKVLDTAQQIGPVIEQYGPMIKNLPMLWRLYKGFRDLPSESETTDAENKVDSQEDSVEEKKSTPRKSTQRSKGASTPKLYI